MYYVGPIYTTHMDSMDLDALSSHLCSPTLNESTKVIALLPSVLLIPVKYMCVG